MDTHRIGGFRLVTALCVGVYLFSAAFVGQTAIVHAEAASRTTAHPSSVRPDQVCLTWSDDPGTTQTIQWRTSPKVKKGVVQFYEESSQTDKYERKKAGMSVVEDPGTSNDPVNHRFTAVLDHLDPGTTYAYRVGGRKGWSEWFEFTTAPQTVEPFSFVYMGDPQAGLDTWGRLLHAAYERCPNAAFCVVAGVNVNRGNNRDEWDNLFHAAGGVFDRRPYVPALGNHDCPKEVGPRLYLELLALPENGPKTVAAERAYRLDYGNAMLLVLDSNSPPETQVAWIEEQLQTTQAVWKFAVYHHPAYSSAPKRDNPDIREQWGGLFDQYHVDIALQGHDHGYLRTKPMRAGKEAASPAEGTVYVVSVSGTKLYDVEQHDYAAKYIDHLSTYQVIDIQTENENRLTYRAYDMDGNLQDELVIVK